MNIIKHMLNIYSYNNKFGYEYNKNMFVLLDYEFKISDVMITFPNNKNIHKKLYTKGLINFQIKNDENVKAILKKLFNE